MIILENDKLKATVSPKGAELKTLYHKEGKRELLWSGKKDVWPRTSPVLFPVVGRLKDNTFTYKGNSYTLPQHGFARDMEFACLATTEKGATFRLESDYKTQEAYPFLFELTIDYNLVGACLEVRYQVRNPAREDMYFSIGAHPGFACAPSHSNLDVKASLKLDSSKELLVYRLANGLLQKDPTEGLLTTWEGEVGLTDELIENDAMVFKKSPGRWIDLKVPGLAGSLRMVAKDWPYFGIWSKERAPFVCLEPWYGIADVENTNQDITKKEGIIRLKPEATWKAEWSVEVRR